MRHFSVNFSINSKWTDYHGLLKSPVPVPCIANTRAVKKPLPYLKKIAYHCPPSPDSPEHFAIYKYAQYSHFRSDSIMDWIAVISFIAGIVLVIIGIALIINMPVIMVLFEKIVGVLCVFLGAVALIFAWKLIKSVNV
jgi:hypothetical protein